MDGPHESHGEVLIPDGIGKSIERRSGSIGQQQMELAINNHKLDICIELMVKNEGSWLYGICIDGSSPIIMALEAFCELAWHDPKGTSIRLAQGCI